VERRLKGEAASVRWDERAKRTQFGGRQNGPQVFGPYGFMQDWHRDSTAENEANLPLVGLPELALFRTFPCSALLPHSSELASFRMSVPLEA
jgi:hypothetical protein